MTQTSTEAATQTPWIITTSPQVADNVQPAPRGTFILSLPDGGFYHLFAYSPESLPLTRLTANPWDDIAPALGPDGNWLAYASRQNGYWDLYLLNLQDGGSLRLTDTLAYDGSPSWSPDGAWLVYETYGEKSLEIAIRSVTDPASAPIQLTSDNYLDTSPAWSPLGRQIAFVSNRSGEPEIWIIDLDRATSDQFVNVSRSQETVESHPAWSPDGTRLAWASADPSTGLTSIQVWDARTPDSPAVSVVAGDWPVWQDNGHIAARFSSPNQTHLAGYDVSNSILDLPPILLPGSLEGLTYGVISASLPGVFLAGAQVTPASLYVPALDPDADTLPGRTALVEITGIQAAYPQLSDAADEAFAALRFRVAYETGWDALASLENAFVPLSTPLDPGLGEDWLYTGRGFTLNPALVQAGWMVAVREDFGQQTWWRIYLRTSAQDGSQGRPLTQLPWDFAARTGSSQAYENGGALMDSIPGGYWLDLTSLAAEYGWDRLPALTNWRTYYAGAHFNELAYIQDTDWRSAMLELYPPEALLTPTVVIPPTRTPTRTPLWYRSPTPTRTPTPRPTSTP
ncbi:MAG: PD40 domain-containing protein [Chloroflexi bacterium]|nr:PD40 domain-containing protein [Chloroflexota bacterium]